MRTMLGTGAPPTPWPSPTSGGGGCSPIAAEPRSTSRPLSRSAAPGVITWMKLCSLSMQVIPAYTCLFSFLVFWVRELFITCTCNVRNHKCQVIGHSQQKLPAAPLLGQWQIVSFLYFAQVSSHSLQECGIALAQVMPPCVLQTCPHSLQKMWHCFGSCINLLQ